jgi:hypothetical protein
LRPVLGYDPHARREPRGLRLVQTLASIIERVFTIALLCCVFVIIGVITAAESSQSANSALAAYLHYDVKVHIDALLALLHIHLQK